MLNTDEMTGVQFNVNELVSSLFLSGKSDSIETDPESTIDGTSVASNHDSLIANWLIGKKQAIGDTDSRLAIIQSQSKLSLAIICQTARDYMSTDKKNLKIKQDAVDWLSDTVSFEIYSLRYCCALINSQLEIILKTDSFPRLTPERVSTAILDNPQGFIKALSDSRISRCLNADGEAVSPSSTLHIDDIDGLDVESTDWSNYG